VIKYAIISQKMEDTIANMRSRMGRLGDPNRTPLFKLQSYLLSDCNLVSTSAVTQSPFEDNGKWEDLTIRGPIIGSFEDVIGPSENPLYLSILSLLWQRVGGHFNCKIFTSTWWQIYWTFDGSVEGYAKFTMVKDVLKHEGAEYHISDPDIFFLLSKDFHASHRSG